MPKDWLFDASSNVFHSLCRLSPNNTAKPKDTAFATLPVLCCTYVTAFESITSAGVVGTRAYSVVPLKARERLK